MIMVLFDNMAKLGIFKVSFVVKFMPAVTGMAWPVVGLVNTTSMGNFGVKFEGRTSGITCEFVKEDSMVGILVSCA